MKSLSISGDKRMTVKEVAEALGYQPDTIQGKVKELFPQLVKNGVASRLTMAEVDIIKQNIVPRNLGLKSEVAKAVTPIDIERMTLQVIEYHATRVRELEYELAGTRPKVESHDALMRCESTMSVTDAAKHFGLHPRTQVFPYLRDSGYLTLADLPTQAAIDAGYLVLKEVKCQSDVIRPQAAVEVRQLETWRTRILPQIKRWESKGATA